MVKIRELIYLFMLKYLVYVLPYYMQAHITLL